MMQAPLPEKAEAILAKHARSFRLASWFLPREQAEDAALAYAFCRYIDDLADESPDAVEAEASLNDLRGQLLSPSPESPLVAAIQQQALRLRMPLTPWLELIAGAQTDLKPVRMQTTAELLRYCYRVAGTVGWLMCGILKVEDPRALAHAIDLGIAMQLTNICRDVAEDARRGRVYLPADLLGNLEAKQLQGEPGDAVISRVQHAVRSLLALAERWYSSGDAGVGYIPARCRLAILIAARLYRAIGRRLLRHGANPMRGRTVVSVVEKSLSIFAATTYFLYSHLARPGDHDIRLHQPLAGLPGTRG